MTRRKVSNPLALAVLACVIERPMHPYEISKTLRQRAKEESIKLNYGSLYSVVESLRRHRLIAPVETGRDGRRPERTVYGPTDAGRTEFVDWLAELLSTPTKEFTQFEAGLSLLAGLPPDDVAELLEDRAQKLVLELHSMRAMHEAAVEQGLPRLFWIEAEYRNALRQAELDFVRRLARDIGEGTLEGIEMWRAFHETGEVPQLDMPERRPRLRSVSE